MRMASGVGREETSAGETDEIALISGRKREAGDGSDEGVGMGMC